MGTEVRYGEIRLSFVKTEALDAVPAMDPSGTDQLYTKFTYQCSGIFTKESDPALANETPAETYQRVRHMLTRPRQELEITSDGRTLLRSAELDANNGPKPLPGLVITKVTDECLSVTWGVEVCLRDCEDFSGTSPVLSLRWTRTHDVSEANLSTFVTAGRLIAAADLLNGKSIDDLRPLCVPDQPPNTVRKSSVSIQADGLALDFRFTDTEEYQMPPPNSGVARIVDGELVKVITGGVVRTISTTFTLEGKKEEPRRRLMATCTGMALARLRAARPGGGRLLIRSGALREKQQQNLVSVTLEAWAADDQGTGAANELAVLAGKLSVGAILALPGNNPEAVLQMGKDAAEAAKRLQKIPKDDGQPKALVGIGLDGFGVRLAGCPDPLDEVPGISPDLYGRYDRLRMLAAALRDPCLAKAADEAEWFAKPKPGPPPSPGQGAPTPAGSRPAAPATEPVSLVASRPPAVVRLVTSLPPTATFQISTYANDPHAGIYTEYEVTLTYHDDRGGRYVGQATKEGEPGKVFQRTNPQVTLVAEWTARKYGGPPKVPDPDTTDGNAICVDVGAVLESINVAADGITPVFTASGTYKYEFLDAKKVSLVTPVPPWMALSPSQVPGYPTGGKDVFGNGTRTSTLRSR